MIEGHENPDSNVIKAKDVPKLQPYFKMLKLGVPMEAVKLKMTRENVDAFLLDDPDAVIKAD